MPRNIMAMISALCGPKNITFCNILIQKWCTYLPVCTCAECKHWRWTSAECKHWSWTCAHSLTSMCYRRSKELVEQWNILMYLSYLVSVSVKRNCFLRGIPVEGLIGKEAGFWPFGNKVKQIFLALLYFISKPHWKVRMLKIFLWRLLWKWKKEVENLNWKTVPL